MASPDPQPVVEAAPSALAVWTRAVHPTRRPRLTRDDIAAAAMRIADADGFDAISMRRIATELNAGTMTLYHYVTTKDELLSLVVDAVMGEVVIPDDEPFPQHWREAITLIAWRTRTALERHPWILDLTDDPAFGPSSVRHFDQTLQAVSSLNVSLRDKFDIVTAVDEYVFGHCVHNRDHVHDDEHTFDDETLAYVDTLIASGSYPQLAALMAEYGRDDLWQVIGDHMRDPDRFARNLSRLLDGMEAALPTPETQ